MKAKYHLSIYVSIIFLFAVWITIFQEFLNIHIFSVIITKNINFVVVLEFWFNCFVLAFFCLFVCFLFVRKEAGLELPVIIQFLSAVASELCHYTCLQSCLGSKLRCKIGWSELCSSEVTESHLLFSSGIFFILR